MEQPIQLTDTQKSELRKLEIVVCYLHGSVAEGGAGRESDVDIAALFERMPTDPIAASAGIVAALRGFIPEREMDVAILNNASPLLMQRVAAHGVLLLERVPGDDLAFQIRAMHEYESSRHIAHIGRDLALARAGLENHD